MSKWTPVDNDEATSLIGEGLHTGLRKGTDAPEAHDLWESIRNSDQAWSDALNYLMWGLETMGYRLCKEVK